MRMALGEQRQIEPNRDDADEGDIAICVTDDEFVVFEYGRDKPSFLATEMEWQDVSVDLDKLDLGQIDGAELERDPDTGYVWLYADHIDPDDPIDVQETSAEDQDEENMDETEYTEQIPFGQYELEFSDGKKIAGSAQVEVMGKAINYLIDEHDLIEVIEMPYMSGYKNSLINVKREHPDGREMKRPHQTDEGFWVETSMSKDQKKDYIKELSGKVGIRVEFVRGWE